MLSKFKNWISSLFATKAEAIPAEDELSVYKLHNRTIYHYDNGEEVVKEDPIVLYKKVMAVGPELGVDIKIARSPSKSAREAHDKMINKIRGIFSLKPFKEGGLTEQETADLLDDFLLFCESIKKNSRVSTISAKETSTPTPTSSAPASTTPTMPVEPQPTQNTSVSGSTEKEVTTNTQQPLPSEPVLPLAQLNQA